MEWGWGWGSKTCPRLTRIVILKWGQPMGLGHSVGTLLLHPEILYSTVHSTLVKPAAKSCNLSIQKMAKTIFSLLFFLTLTSISSSQPSSSSPNPDFQPLISFKSSSDPSNHLTNWNKTTSPCNWTGVSCSQNRVTHLVLENLSLTGSFHSLTSLTKLHVLSLKHNHFSGPLPDLSNLTSLKLLFLSDNSFSGPFPPSVLSLSRLYRLDLSYNNFSGQIPSNIAHLTHLLTVRLEENDFSGPIPTFQFPSLEDFNVSGNRLTGEIPASLSGFPETAFDRNPVLCGSPLPKCKSVVSDPSKPNGAGKSPLTPPVVSSSPTSDPVISSSSSPIKSENSHGKMSLVAVIAIIFADVVVLALISGLLFYCFWRKMAGKFGYGKQSRLLETEKIVYSSSPYGNHPQPQGGFERGKMVFFEGIKPFELEDLLRASAEMLGKGGFGTAYKAVLDGGNVVAVKRLKDIQVGGKREFEEHVEILGRLRHPNVVSLKAYYLAREEKLLVFDYMPNGSLFWLLHGNRGPGRTPLDWTTRLKIAAGVAHGIAFIQHSCRSPRLSHGNIKSTNVLIDRAGNPRVSDFGLSIFASPTMYTRLNGYRAPEASFDGAKFSHQKADVYSFGVLLLEILTGKCPLFADDNGGPGSSTTSIDLPRWVQSVVREEWTAEVFDLELMGCKGIEEEMVGLLQIAMSCTCVVPDQRPKIRQVVKMIEELRGVDEFSSPSQESSFDSMTDSPSFSEDRTV